MQYIKDSLKLVGMISFLLTSMIVNAQDKINIDKGEIKTWFENYWMWVVGGLVLLVLLIALMGRSRRIARNGTRKTTTVVKDEQGRTQSVTTTEEPIQLS
jgi:flagellar biosynthesis/type III secretory pathway M-ring protein FliF/YscJ